MDSVRLHASSPQKANCSVRYIAECLGLSVDEAKILKVHRPKKFDPEPQNCFFNVLVQIRCEGGDMQHGWLIAQDSTKGFIEAQFHAVWININGELVDVTPRLDGEKRVMFIPDYEREILLSDSSGRPAILSYDNFRVFQGRPLSELERIKIVLQDTTFIEVHGLLRA